MFMFIKCWLGAWGLNTPHCAKFAIKKSRAKCSNRADLIPCHTKKKNANHRSLTICYLRSNFWSSWTVSWYFPTHLNTLHGSLTQLWEWAVRSLPKAPLMHVLTLGWGLCCTQALAREMLQTPVPRPDLALLTSDWQPRLLPDFWFPSLCSSYSLINSEVYVYIQVHISECGFSHKWKDLHVCMCLCVWKVRGEGCCSRVNM